MKQFFGLTNTLNRLFIIAIGFGLFSCASFNKPTVVITKPDYPTKKEEVIVVKEEEKKVDDGEIEEIPIKDVKVLPSLVKVEQVLSEAEAYLGTPHRMGGLSRKGIDCSGLVLVSYKKVNLALPRSTRDQVRSGKAVSMDKLQKGDLVFFTYPGGSRITHVGMVHEVKGPKDIVFIHTSSSRGVRKDNLYSSYWKPLFVKARRII